MYCLATRVLYNLCIVSSGVERNVKLPFHCRCCCCFDLMHNTGYKLSVKKNTKMWFYRQRSCCYYRIMYVNSSSGRDGCFFIWFFQGWHVASFFFPQGLGTTESILTRVLVCRSEIDLLDIRAEYKKLFGCSLYSQLAVSTPTPTKTFHCSLLYIWRFNNLNVGYCFELSGISFNELNLF